MNNLTDQENALIESYAKEFINDFDNYFEAYNYFLRMYEEPEWRIC